MHAFVLCAGLGTRLRPLTAELPKPVVPVLDRPLVAWTLRWLSKHAGRVVVNTHHLAERVVSALAPWAERNEVTLREVRETELLGTGGAIRNALPYLGDAPFLVCNGDVLTAPSIEALRRAHTAHDADVTLVLREDPDVPITSSIEVDSSDRVVRIIGDGEAIPGTRRCMFTGVYMVSPRIGAHLPERGCVLRHTVRALLAGGRIRAVLDRSPWLDLGTVPAYANACFDLASGRIAMDHVAAPLHNNEVWSPLGEPVALAHESQRVVVGPGAVVVGRPVLRNVIVWPGARVETSLSNMIVTTEGQHVPIE